MRDKEPHYSKKEATIEVIVEERILMGDTEDDRNGFLDEEEMPRSLINAKLLGGATENEEHGEMGDPATAGEEMVVRVSGMIVAALDAVRAAAGFPGRWKAIVTTLEKLRACLVNTSRHLGQLESYDNALCHEVLQSVADTLVAMTDIAGQCRAPMTAGKLHFQSSIDAVAVKLDVNLHDCKLLVKIGELYDNASSSHPLEDTSTCVELQRLLVWVRRSHTEAKNLALDRLLEALHKDEKSVVASVLHHGDISAMVQLLATSWPMVVREKAATVVSHVVGSCRLDLLRSEGAIPPLIRLAESGSLVGRQKAAVALHYLSTRLNSTVSAIVSHGGVRPLVEMCRHERGDSVSQFAAAGTLKNISAEPDIRQSLADNGTIRVMVDLLGRDDVVLESKEHAVRCLANLTARYNDDKLRRSVLLEGGMCGLLLYLNNNEDWNKAAVNAIRNLVDVITTSSSAGDTTTMKRVAGEQGCVPLLVRMILEHNSDSVREVAVQMLACLATYPPNVREMNKDDKCVAGLVQLLDPSRYNTATNEYAIQCLLSLASSTKRCRKLMVSHGANGHLKMLSDMNVQGATELLQRLKRGMLQSLFSSSKQ
ncbi:hypothetical protein PR202_gb13407 [Eleusine coracana subsp. coracana]|uniref:DUF7032 domain-containing protein n=1 Tax=Eleusine coracana subsp. coracana TaxID=191504 RepID=A0AAV5ES15_ELECO|nr:hypothetical protein PR202_gb13407 [Eleusine coracana subsp. coracana]